MLVSYRRELVGDRTAGANRLHADLGKLRPGYHQNIPLLTIRQSLDQAMKLLWRDTTPHARVAKQRIRRLRQLDIEIKELTTEIAELVTQSGTRLLDLHGVGVLVAATILSEVGNPRRYATKDKFATANGTAPIEASSGRVVTPSTQPRWEPPNQPGHPHRRFDPDRPQRQRRPPLLPKTHHPRKDPQRHHTRPQKTNLRPHLDPPPTTKTNPDFDIGAHYPLRVPRVQAPSFTALGVSDSSQPPLRSLCALWHLCANDLVADTLIFSAFPWSWGLRPFRRELWAGRGPCCGCPVSDLGMSMIAFSRGFNPGETRSPPSLTALSLVPAG